MAERGRPKVFDEEKRTLVCGLVGMGCTRKQAARHLGVGPTTLFETLRKDKDFAERLRRAEMNQDITPLRRILDHSQKSWRAAAWILERQDPNRYGRRPPRTMTVGEANEVLKGILEFTLAGIRSHEDRQTALDALKQLTDALGGGRDTSSRVRRALKDLSAEREQSAPPEFPYRPAGSENAENRSEPAKNTWFEQGGGI